MESAGKYVKIYPDVDPERAIRVLDMYLDSLYPEMLGVDSLRIYTNGTDPDIRVHTTPTSYIIRLVEVQP